MGTSNDDCCRICRRGGGTMLELTDGGSIGPVHLGTACATWALEIHFCLLWGEPGWRRSLARRWRRYLAQTRGPAAQVEERT